MAGQGGAGQRPTGAGGLGPVAGEGPEPGAGPGGAEPVGAGVCTALTSFTGDARPYGGGNPFADYRSAELPFAGLVDLADRRLGAGVIAANDEFFAERENLLLPGRAVFDPERFGHKGKMMDGWETRRRRGALRAGPASRRRTDHDWALVRLGAPGVIRGIVVDTAHFRGNYPQAVSVEARRMPPSAAPDGPARSGGRVDRAHAADAGRRPRGERLRGPCRSAASPI